MYSLKIFSTLGTKIAQNSLHLRCFHTAVINRDIFKVQDEIDFEKRVIQNKNLVILDFYATWCGPCKMLTPRLETVVGAHTKSGVDLAKVDVDELEKISGQYKVESIPAVYAIKNGKIVDHFVGLKDNDQLENFIEKALAK